MFEHRPAICQAVAGKFFGEAIAFGTPAYPAFSDGFARVITKELWQLSRGCNIVSRG